MSSHFEYERDENILGKSGRELSAVTEKGHRASCLRNPGLLLSYLMAIPPKISTVSQTTDGERSGAHGRQVPYVYTSESVTDISIPKL